MSNEYTKKGSYLCKNGPAQKISSQYCNKKLCFASTDQFFLIKLLDKLSKMADCFFVKYSAEPRDGMFLGRCFFTDENVVGEVWGRYKAHPKVFCNVQDDDFTTLHRDKVLSWKDKNPQEL